MTDCIYITALQYSCERVDTESEDEARKGLDKVR